MVVGPPFGDFSPDDYEVFDDEKDEEEGPEEQGHAPPPASPQDEGEMPASGGDAGVEPPPRAASPSNPAGGTEIRQRVRSPSAPDSYRRRRRQELVDAGSFEDLVGKLWGFSNTKRARR